MGIMKIEFTFHSKVLEFDTPVCALIPFEENRTDPAAKYQTLYLYHGGHGDCEDFLSYSAIQELAMKHRLAVIMPSVNNSFCQNLYRGKDFFLFMNEEIPSVCEKLFPLSTAGENRFAGGISMGGYGAVRLALTDPDRFSAAFSLGGALDFPMGMYESVNGLVWNPFRPETICENPLEMEGTDSDLKELARRLKKTGRRIPGLFLRCGAQDIYCHHMNLSVLKSWKEDDIPFLYEEGDFPHSWEYWRKCLPGALDWLPLKNSYVKES